MTEQQYPRAVEIHTWIDGIRKDFCFICDSRTIIYDKNNRELKGEERERAILKAKEEANKKIQKLREEFESL